MSHERPHPRVLNLKSQVNGGWIHTKGFPGNYQTTQYNVSGESYRLLEAYLSEGDAREGHIEHVNHPPSW